MPTAIASGGVRPVSVRGLVALVIAALVTMSAPSGRAARDETPAKAASVRQELIVLEAPNCTYCAVFRRDVLPAYLRSPRATDLPLRFLDLNDPAADQLRLTSSVDMVPTIVLMRDGREADRITGYMGREAFFQSVGRMVTSGQ